MNLQEISDHLEIQNVVHRLLWGFDTRDWVSVQGLLADPVRIDYTAMFGGEAGTVAAAEQ